MAQRELKIRVSGEDAGASATFARLGKNISHSLEEIKGAVGRGSTFKELGELLVGGGAAIGVTYLARDLKEAADHGLELVNAMKEGKATVGDTVGEIAKSLPIAGEVAQAFRSIGELFMEGISEGLRQMFLTEEQI